MMEEETKEQGKECLMCGKEMTEVFDEIAQEYTGNIWHCDDCMPDGTNLSIG